MRRIRNEGKRKKIPRKRQKRKSQKQNNEGPSKIRNEKKKRRVRSWEGEKRKETGELKREGKKKENQHYLRSVFLSPLVWLNLAQYSTSFRHPSSTCACIQRGHRGNVSKGWENKYPQTIKLAPPAKPA